MHPSSRIREPSTGEYVSFEKHRAGSSPTAPPPLAPTPEPVKIGYERPAPVDPDGENPEPARIYAVDTDPSSLIRAGSVAASAVTSRNPRAAAAGLAAAVDILVDSRPGQDSGRRHDHSALDRSGTKAPRAVAGPTAPSEAVETGERRQRRRFRCSRQRCRIVRRSRESDHG